MAQLTDNQRKEIVDKIISGCECWNEEDRPTLNGLADDKLTSMLTHIEDHAHKTAVANAALQGFKHGDVGFTFNKETLKFDAKEEPKPPKKEEAAPAAPAGTVLNAEPKKPATVDEYLAQAPPELRSVLTNALAAEKKTKDALIATITANKANVFKPEYLAARSVEELEGIAALAKQAAAPVANYLGSAAPATMARNEEKEEPLMLPSIDWSKKD